MMILSLAACSSKPIVPPAKIVTKTEYVTPTAPIVPKPDVLSLRDIKFIIITPENAAEVFAKLKDEKVLFALTAKGYEDTALNLSDIRAYMRQQNRVIILYQDSFKPVNPEPIKPN
jgi:hypothetical protein